MKATGVQVSTYFLTSHPTHLGEISCEKTDQLNWLIKILLIQHFPKVLARNFKNSLLEPEKRGNWWGSHSSAHLRMSG